MRYLKTKVLGGMQARGDVLKMTRARWERAQQAQARAASQHDQGQNVVAEDIAAAATAGNGATTTTEATSATAVKELTRREEEHVWVTRDMWEPLREAGVKLPRAVSGAASTSAVKAERR
jgi:hypothetical protein